MDKKQKAIKKLQDLVNSISKSYSVSIDEYVNNKTKIKFFHKDCGTYFYMASQDFKKGCRCPNCRIKRTKETNLKKHGYEYGIQSQKAKEGIIQKYGVDNVFKLQYIQEKIKETNIEKYGNPNPLQNEEIYNKMINTNIEKYGVENVFQSELIKKKIKETSIKKYGSEHAMQNKEIKNKSKETCLLKYGVDNYFKTNIIKELSKKLTLKRKYESLFENKNSEPRFSLQEYNGMDKSYEFICKHCGYIFASNAGYAFCPECFDIKEKIKSYVELSFQEFLNEYKIILIQI